MLLAKAGSSLTVKTLLENLQITTEFENSMVKKWATSVSFFVNGSILVLMPIISFKQCLLRRQVHILFHPNQYLLLLNPT